MSASTLGNVSIRVLGSLQITALIEVSREKILGLSTRLSFALGV